MARCKPRLPGTGTRTVLVAIGVNMGFWSCHLTRQFGGGKRRDRAVIVACGEYALPHEVLNELRSRAAWVARLLERFASAVEAGRDCAEEGTHLGVFLGRCGLPVTRERCLEQITGFGNWPERIGYQGGGLNAPRPQRAHGVESIIIYRRTQPYFTCAQHPTSFNPLLRAASVVSARSENTRSPRRLNCLYSNAVL